MIINKIKSFLLISTLMLSMSSSQTIHQIAAGTDVLGPAISDAASGDIIELVTDGGVYLNSSQFTIDQDITCLLYTSPRPRELSTSRMPSSA